ncbi:hypothetical protein [Streptomyces sp. NPDC048489]|uniref:hypothetical protein n=1 Tax=Streptomyces sp. NPDC048489 TaxID=3154504 RepID=UPI00343AE109
MPDRPQRLLPLRLLRVPLAPNRLLHTGPLEAFDKTKAGIYLIEIPARTRTDMPHPLGRLIDRPDEQGRVWVTTPHLKQLERLHRDGHLAEPAVIHDSWTGKINESLFKPFYEAARSARTVRPWPRHYLFEPRRIGRANIPPAEPEPRTCAAACTSVLAVLSTEQVTNRSPTTGSHHEAIASCCNRGSATRPTWLWDPRRIDARSPP